MISTEEIRIAIRMITLLKLDGESKVFERVEKVLEIGQTKLYELWADWCSRDGDKLPKSFIGAPRIERPSTVIVVFRRDSEICS